MYVCFYSKDELIIIAWNGSFLPLDLLISTSGLISIYLHKNERTL
ncbi:DUF5360 family protein [Bacillus swezeyi]